LQTDIEMMKELTEASGVAGFEHEIREVLGRYLSPYATLSTDGLGSLIARQEGRTAGPNIMLAAHMDEVGFMVKAVTKEGFIKFLPLGGWWEQVLLSQRVMVKTRKGDVPGVIGSKPPHVLTEEERNKVVGLSNMFIDVGAKSKDEAEKTLGIRPGDPIVPICPFTVLGSGTRYLAKAWDDRVGCALLCDAFKELSRLELRSAITGVGTVQEEVGTRGAQTSASAVCPDLAIILEVGLAVDVPGTDKEGVYEKMGLGPNIYLYDRSMIPNLKLRDFVVDLAEGSGIPYQFAFMERGATDAGKIHLHASGVPSIVISVPTRYIHSHAGIIAKDDYENTLRLVLEVISNVDADAIAGFDI
jgi:putative aminopeptidase FrvX